MTRPEQAEAFFKEGYNCAQAVAMAWADEMGFTPAQAARLAVSYGGGISGMRETCGALLGMAMVAGALYGPSNPAQKEEKRKHYERVRAIIEQFGQENGAIDCRTLIGPKEAAQSTPQDRTPAYYRKRPCAELVRSTAEMFAQAIASGAFDAPSQEG